MQIVTTLIYIKKEHQRKIDVVHYMQISKDKINRTIHTVNLSILDVFEFTLVNGTVMHYSLSSVVFVITNIYILVQIPVNWLWKSLVVPDRTSVV